MKCPVDDTVLSISDRHGVEIDWCPTCRGVWLDRGELDKMIERSMSEPTSPAAPGPSRPDDRDRAPDRDRYGDGDHRDGDRDGRKRPKKKTSMLSELFDF